MYQYSAVSVLDILCTIVKLGALRVFLSDSSLLLIRLGLPSFITLFVMGAVHTVDMKCPLDRTSL